MKNYPDTATRIEFRPLSGKMYKYRVWEKDRQHYWYAQGHSGVAASREEAMRAAREWILYGIHGLQTHAGVTHAGSYGSRTLIS